MNKINILTIAMLATTLSLSGCGGGGGGSSDSTNTSLNFNIDSGNIYDGIAYTITTSNIESMNAKYGTVTKRAQTQADTNSIVYTWEYTLSADQIRNITEFPYVEEFYFTSTEGLTGTKMVSIYPTNLDPLLVQQWHINNNGYNYFDTTLAPQKGIDLNVLNAWKQKDSKGQNITGKDIKIIAVDSKTDFIHEDLPTPYTPTNTYDTLVNEDISLLEIFSGTDILHGTMVSGILGARANNGRGGRGIAYDSNLASIYLNYFEELNTQKLLSDKNNVDVINASFGYMKSINIDNITIYLEEAYKNNIPLVKANGNSFKDHFYNSLDTSPYTGCKTLTHTSKPVDCSFVQASSLERSPYNIMVGAMNALGQKSTYSSTGANLWISALGGEYGYKQTSSGTSAGIVTTLSSYNLNQDLPMADFDRGTPWRNDKNVYYTAKMNGTSSAAPEITGIVALIKQARPTATVPQIKYILARTARNNSVISTMDYNPIYDDNGLLVEQGWITNNAGWKFSKYYGFGLADAGKAVELALNCDIDPLCKQKDELPVEYISSDSTCNTSLDDKYGNITECTFTNFNFKDKDSNSISLPNNAQIDNVSVYFKCLPTDAPSASVANPYTQFELISNHGTKSIIKNMYSNWDYFHPTISTNSDTNLNSSAFYHETLSANDTFKFRVYSNSEYSLNADTLKDKDNCDINLHIWAYESK